MEQAPPVLKGRTSCQDCSVVYTCIGFYLYHCCWEICEKSCKKSPHIKKYAIWVGFQRRPGEISLSLVSPVLSPLCGKNQVIPLVWRLSCLRPNLPTWTTVTAMITTHCVTHLSSTPLAVSLEMSTSLIRWLIPYQQAPKALRILGHVPVYWDTNHI